MKFYDTERIIIFNYSNYRSTVGKKIVKLRYIILALFIAALVAAGMMLPDMIGKVNYDLTSYLPEGYDTYDGYQFISENFEIHGDVEIGVEAKYADVKRAADAISKIDGVTGVTWADMLSYLIDFGVYDKNDPESLAKFEKLYSVLTDAPVTDDGQAHNWAVLVTLKYPPSSTEAIKIFQQIKTTLGDTVGAGNFAMSGMTEQANALFETVFDELWLYCLIAGIVVLIILAFTTNSLMEPIILLLTLGISIIVNLGTNAWFPSTSIITFACTAILQLGLSMDYAIFMLHQYRTELTKTPDSKEALANAVPKATNAVLASALTTVGGFLAFLCMKFGVGSDLGLSLAKGILCSLLTVVFLQPCLMYFFEKARVKTQHKCLDFHFKAPVKRVIKNRGWVGLVFAVLFIPICVASNSLSYAYVKFLPPSADTSQKQVLAEKMGNQLMVVIPTKTGEVLSAQALADENYEFIDRVRALGEDKISFVLGLFAMFPEDATISKQAVLDQMGDADIPEDLKPLLDMMPEEMNLKLLLTMMAKFSDRLEGIDLGMLNGYIAENGYTMYTVGINPAIDLESDESFAILDEIKAIANEIFTSKGYGRCYFTGMTQGAYDFAKITPTDFMWVTIISILAILIILMFTLGGVKLPILLVALIEFGIWINFSMQFIFAAGTINFMSYIIIGAVQLGATVDYAILVSTKYRALRKRFEPRQAAYAATTESAMSIVTSALIMSGACFSVFFVSTNLVIKEMTFLMARGAIISAILVIFVLPAILTITDRVRGGEIHIPRTPKLRPYKMKKRVKKSKIKPCGAEK